jgi:Flp pilus assembly pilin Flp
MRTQCDPLRTFLRDEAGSAVVDWSVLTTTTILVAGHLVDGVGDQVLAMADGVAAALGRMEVPVSFEDYARLQRRPGS